MKYVLLTLLMCASYGMKAQPGYKIEFTIEGLKDTTTYLGYYLGEQTYVTDTARVNGKGYFVFSGKEALPEGAYFMAINTALQFQLVIGKDQHFTLSTRKDDYIKHMKVTGDEDNRLFFENLQFNADRYKEAEPFIKMLKDSSATEATKENARQKYQEVFAKVKARQNEVIEQYPTLVSSRWLMVNKDIDVPPPPRKPNGQIDSTFQLYYYRRHYFDYFDVSDAALLRLPQGAYAKKIKDYLDRLVVPHPDSLIKEVNRLALKSQANQETYKWFVWTCLTHFQTHPIMGLDEVYVRIYDQYVATGKMDFWLDPKMKQSVTETVSKVRLSLIGNTAPNLIMQDQSLKPTSLYDIKSKYTIVYFYRPTCGHCREETPLLVDFYHKNKKAFDLEVFAVDIDTSLQEMKKFATEMKTPWITVNGPRTYVGPFNKLYHAELTPTIYILDEKKKIIAKKLGIEQFEDFLTKHSKKKLKG